MVYSNHPAGPERDRGFSFHPQPLVPGLAMKSLSNSQNRVGVFAPCLKSLVQRHHLSITWASPKWRQLVIGSGMVQLRVCFMLRLNLRVNLALAEFLGLYGVRGLLWRQRTYRVLVENRI